MKKKMMALLLMFGLLLVLPGCTTSFGQSTSQDQGGKITQETAVTLAMKQAGVDEEDVLSSGVRECREDGVKCYEVVFFTKDTDYEYVINQADGTLVESDKESFDFSWGTPEGAGITKEEAENIVMGKVPGAKSDNIRMKAEVEHGRIIYEGEIIYEDTKYEYEMDAQTGQLLEWSQNDLF